MQSSDAVKQQTPITHVAENGINTAWAEQFAYGGTRPRVHYERDSCASLSAEMFRKHDCGHQGTECTFRSHICCVERISSDNTDGSECRHSDALAAIPTQYGRDLQHTGAYLRSSIWLHIVCPPETMARLCPRPSFTSVPRGLLHVHPSLSRSSLWAALLDLHSLFTNCTPLIIHIYRASALYALFRS